eukprot:CAMPEP_0202494720 /NCGR_PEP_ID=MMETSP1361-20130828/13391_1 /ASSEMBLY_ACC=CAM_ASM_000849 /TAXON_ID=210615 /ORGANISM="Staurosira complex sp., Strain CCMP2646" /LENGTH=36 /DNA_ID= /DNA_START= /DNA_END= /DNA_ORIENTATION=
MTLQDLTSLSNNITRLAKLLLDNANQGSKEVMEVVS